MDGFAPYVAHLLDREEMCLPCGCCFVAAWVKRVKCGRGDQTERWLCHRISTEIGWRSIAIYVVGDVAVCLQSLKFIKRTRLILDKSALGFLHQL
jgi:hypothetical protein